MKKIRVLIVDDQTLMRDGLKTILNYKEDIEVMGTASSGFETLKMLEENVVDVILMDIRMEGMDGIECTRLIKERYPQIIVLILTTFNEEEYIRDSLKVKAGGYLLKDMEGDKLVQTIKYAYEGNLIMPYSVAAKLSNIFSDEDSESPHINVEVDNENKIHFSKLEMDIIKLMVEGCTNKQIASLLYISYGTVKNYVSQIYEKIGFSERVKAVTALKTMLKL